MKGRGRKKGSKKARLSKREAEALAILKRSRAAKKAWKVRKFGKKAVAKSETLAKKRRAGAAKKGWEKRKKREAEAQKRQAKRLARDRAYRLLEKKLIRMRDDVRRGRGKQAWLASPPAFEDYYAEKIRQKRKLGKTLLTSVLESLQEDLELGDIGWRIVYT